MSSRGHCTGRFSIYHCALALSCLATSYSAEAAVILNTVKTSSALAGHSLYTVTAVSDNPNEPILGFNFAGDPDNNDPATGLGFFGTMAQVNPVGQPTVYQDNNVFFSIIGRNVNEDSQFLFTTSQVVPSAAASQEGPNILQATFAFADPRGLSVPFAQLVIPDAAASNFAYRGDVLVGQSGAGINKRVQGVVTGPENFPPDIQPIVKNIAVGLNEGELVNLQLLGTDEFLPPEELVWSDLVVEGPGKDPNSLFATDPQLNSDGVFSWNPIDWQFGQYKFTATVADEVHKTTEVALTVNLRLAPEPTSLMLVGLAAVGFGAARVRRRE